MTHIHSHVKDPVASDSKKGKAFSLEVKVREMAKTFLSGPCVDVDNIFRKCPTQYLWPKDCSL